MYDRQLEIDRALGELVDISYRNEQKAAATRQRYVSLKASSTYDGGTCYPTNHYMIKRILTRTPHQPIEHVALVDNPEELLVAQALGLYNPPVAKDDSKVVAVLSRELREDPACADAATRLIELCDIVWDADEHKDLTTSPAGIVQYSGHIPDNVAYFTCREEALHLANLFWRSRAISGREGSRAPRRAIKSLKKAEGLINGFLVGHAHFHLTQRRGVVADGYKSRLPMVHFTSTDLPEEVSASSEALSYAKDFTKLWESAMIEARICACLDEEDLLDKKLIENLFSSLCSFTLMESYIETYMAGVAVEDILA